MNIFKIVVLFFLSFLFFSCGGSDITGTFIPKEKNRIKSIEFKDGSARFTDSYLEMKQGAREFDVRGDLIDIQDPFTGSMIFKIVDLDTLKCEIPGMSGLYIRQK